MSQQVEVNYEQLAIRCESVCEVAEKRLQELEQLIEEAEKGSSKLLNDETLLINIRCCNVFC